jgi:hypothetical protein
MIITIRRPSYYGQKLCRLLHITTPAQRRAAYNAELQALGLRRKSRAALDASPTHWKSVGEVLDDPHVRKAIRDLTEYKPSDSTHYDDVPHGDHCDVATTKSGGPR